MREKMISHNGVEICTEYFGERDQPAMLLLAGATVSMLFWDEEFCRRLADRGFFVIRYDNRDVGKSTHYKPGTTPYDIVYLVNDAMAILDAYVLDKAHFVGMSLGGLIAQIAALKHPDRVQSLTLISTGPWGDSDPAIPEMDKRILDFHAKANTVPWSDGRCFIDERKKTL
jgi:pimeloyl-ACP methyl ester carboxylesterase